MRTTSRWAVWRRVQYGTGFLLFWALIGTGVYYLHVYEAPSCFDGMQNAEERGIDCGGACLKICVSDVIPPNIRWTKSFRVRDGQYNVVSYVENQNQAASTEEIAYTLKLFDDDGLITERAGVTPLPPDSVYPIFAGPILTGDRVPTEATLELGESIGWYPGKSSRGQFIIGERDLLGVDTQPRLNAMIRNNAYEPAKNVEIVATIFDIRGNALTSSRTFVENFAPRDEEQIIFTWPEPIAKTIRSCTVPTDVAVAIDLSGSMNNDQADPPEPITTVVAAAKAFVERLRTGDQVALITFASEAQLQDSFTAETERVATMIGELGIAPEEETGSTNTGGAFQRAREAFTNEASGIESRRVMVILTDGLATAPGDSPESFALAEAQKLKDQNVEVYAIGLGNEVNMEFVKQIASDQNKAFQALSLSQIDQIYKTITGSICEDGAAVIDIIPKADVDLYAQPRE